MNVHKNIGNLDVMIRLVILVISVYLGYRVNAWFYLLGVWELFTVLTRWCFVYSLLNIDTLGKIKQGGVR